MAKRTYDDKLTDVIAAIPETGRITHVALQTALETAGKADAAALLFRFGQDKKIEPLVDIDETTSKATLYYSRIQS